MKKLRPAYPLYFPARRLCLTALLVVLLGLAGCEYEFPSGQVRYDPGMLDLSSFVVVGDDYLAGFMDGALYTEGQRNGVGALFAGVLEQAGMEPLMQADIHSDNGLNVYDQEGPGLRGRYVLVYPDEQAQEPEITTTEGEAIPPFEGDRSAVRDLSVPFLRIWQTDRPSLTDNPYYARMALPAPRDVLTERIRALQPTFFLLWIGMSDIMGYASSGGAGDTLYAGTGDPGPADLTSVALFREKMDILTEALLAVPESKGVILTLPDFDDFPFFYYYSYDFIKLPGQQLSLARQTYKAFNDAVAANNSDPANPKRPYIDFNDNGYTAYPQPVVVHDSTLSDAYYPDGRPLEKYRQLGDDERVLLTLPRELLQYGLGSLIPLPEQYYLSTAQVQTLRHRVAAYNAVLREKVAEHPGRLLLVDVHTPLHEIAATGKLDGWGKPESEATPQVQGVPLEARFELYSIYSLDGLHLNARGNAWLTSLIVKALATDYGTTLPAVDVNNHKGNVPVY